MSRCTIRRVVFSVFVFASAIFPGAVHAQDRQEIVKVNGSARAVQVHLPPDYSPRKRYPLVLVLHGSGGNSAQMARISHFNKTADENGFIAAYPNAPDGRWTIAENEGGRTLGGFGRRRNGLDGGFDSPGDTSVGGRPVNDLPFFNELLDQLESEYSVDASRVYATGLSDGGFMVFRLGCELSNRIAAIAPVAATFPQGLAQSCSNWAWRSVSLLMINGTADPVVPYRGRLSYYSGYFLLSAKDSTKAWAKIDGCGPKPQQKTLAPTTRNGSETHVESYSDCKEGAEVVLFSVEKSGHTWPGGEQYLSENEIGRTSGDFDASDVIWKFFAAHPMPAKQ